MLFPIVGPWDEKEAVVSPTLVAIGVSLAATLGLAVVVGLADSYVAAFAPL